MIKTLVQKAVFGRAKREAQQKLKKIAKEKGIFLKSLQPLYQKIAQRELKGFVVPGFNIRTLTFELGRALFRAVKKEKVGAFIIELAQSEIQYTNQSLKEYLSCILGAAIEEKFGGCLFFQGDHFKPKNSLNDLKKLIRSAIKEGFYNIDLDCSRLKIKENATLTGSLTKFIRKLEPKNLSIAIGGEVGEIGGENTTEEQLREFLKNYQKEIYPLLGIIKIAVQTGTAHGKGGKVDFNLLNSLSQKAKQFGLAGIAQHGASTLAEQDFEKFKKAEVLEIHLATIFQNLIFESDYFPKDLKEKIYQWLKEKFSKKEKETDLQFFYRTRKKALGIFKKEIWSLPQKNIDKISQEIEEKFIFFFKKLNVFNTFDLIREVYSLSKNS